MQKPTQMPMSQSPEPPVADMARLLDAIAFSAEKHSKQRRLDVDSSPYINHPLALARVLAVDGGVTDVEVLMAAVLHDTLEDTDTFEAELRERFGSRVTGMVLEVSDDKSQDKTVRKQLQIDHAPHMSPGAALVKLADKTCNLRDVANSPPKGWPVSRRLKYFDWAKAVVDGLPPVSPVLRRLFDEAFAARAGVGKQA